MAQAFIHERRNPEHTKWRAMLTKWVNDNPKTATKECWTCHDLAGAMALVKGRQWCERCDTLASSILPEVSSGECDVFSDDFADSYYDILNAKIKAKLADVPVGAQPPPRDGKTDEKAVENDNTNSNKCDECALCGLACGVDRRSRVPSEVPAKGIVVVHAACRKKLIDWWRASKDCQAASKTLRLSSRQKWSHILCKANAVRDGTGTLEVKATY